MLRILEPASALLLIISSHNGSYVSLGIAFAVVAMIVTSPGAGIEFDKGVYCLTLRYSGAFCESAVAHGYSRMCWQGIVCSVILKMVVIVRLNGPNDCRQVGCVSICGERRELFRSNKSTHNQWQQQLCFSRRLKTFVLVEVSLVHFQLHDAEVSLQNGCMPVSEAARDRPLCYSSDWQCLYRSLKHEDDGKADKLTRKVS